jgi:hypothetical protein
MVHVAHGLGPPLHNMNHHHHHNSHFLVVLIASAYVWYHGECVRITMTTYHDFADATLCSFWKIIVDHRDSDISTVIPNTHSTLSRDIF